MLVFGVFLFVFMFLFMVYIGNVYDYIQNNIMLPAPVVRGEPSKLKVIILFDLSSNFFGIVYVLIWHYVFVF